MCENLTYPMVLKSQRLSLSALVWWPWKAWWTIEPDLLAILYLAIGLTNAKHCSVFKNVTLFFLKLPCQLFISHDFSKPSVAALTLLRHQHGRGGRGSIADVWSSWWWFGALKLVPVLDFGHFRHAPKWPISPQMVIFKHVGNGQNVSLELIFGSRLVANNQEIWNESWKKEGEGGCTLVKFFPFFLYESGP